MDDNDNSKESPVFKSTDILNTKAHNQGEYFVKTGKATLGQKFSSWSRKQKQKQNQAKNQPKTPEDSSALSSSAKKSKKSPKIIIIISVILLAVAACALAIFLLDPFSWKKEPSVPEKDITDTIYDINEEANNILESDPDNGYDAAINHYNEAYEASNESDNKFQIRIQRINFSTYNGHHEESLKELDTINEDELTDKQKFQLYLAYRNIYLLIEDYDAVSKYNDIINNTLPKEITTIGSGD